MVKSKKRYVTWETCTTPASPWKYEESAWQGMLDDGHLSTAFSLRSFSPGFPAAKLPSCRRAAFLLLPEDWAGEPVKRLLEHKAGKPEKQITLLRVIPTMTFQSKEV